MRDIVLITLFLAGSGGCELTDATLQLLNIEDVAPEGTFPGKEFSTEEPGEEIVWNVSPVDAEIPDSVVELSGTLQRLHSTTLTAFESAPSFGGQRMPGVIRESSPPRHFPQLLVGDRDGFGGTGYERPARFDEPTPSEAWRWLKLMSGMCRDGFVYRPFDVYRSLPLKMGDDPPSAELVVCGIPDANPDSYRSFADELSHLPSQLELWKVSSLELIGLSTRETPLVFEYWQENSWTEPVPVSPSRSVDAEEAASLAKLDEGAEIVVTLDAETSMLRMVSAIRATDRCMSCHEVTRGTLLGAFTFRMERLPHSVLIMHRIGEVTDGNERQLNEALKRKISLHLEDAELIDTLAQMLATAGIDNRMDSETLKKQGFPTTSKVTIYVDSIMVISTLHLILEPLNMSFIVDDNVLKITRHSTPTF